MAIKKQGDRKHLSDNIVVGMDPSLTGFGMCAADTDGDGYYCEVFKSKYKGVDRLSDIYDFITNFLDEFGSRVEHVCFEGYAMGMKQSASRSHSLGEAGGVAKLALHNLDVATDFSCPYPTIVPPTSLKKFVMGKGNAKKQQMLLAIYKKWGVEFTDDNMADAYGLAKMAAAMVNVPELQYEKETVEKLVFSNEGLLD